MHRPRAYCGMLCSLEEERRRELQQEEHERWEHLRAVEALFSKPLYNEYSLILTIR